MFSNYCLSLDTIESFHVPFSKHHLREQMLFILLGCTEEEHQIVQLSAQIAHAQLLCRGSVCVGTLLQFPLCFLNN